MFSELLSTVSILDTFTFTSSVLCGTKIFPSITTSITCIIQPQLESDAKQGLLNNVVHFTF